MNMFRRLRLSLRFNRLSKKLNNTRRSFLVRGVSRPSLYDGEGDDGGAVAGTV